MSVLAALPVAHVSALLSAGSGGEGFKDKYPLGPQSFAFKSLWDFTLFGLHFHITRIVTMMLFATLVLIVFFLLASRKPKLVPGKLQFVGESIYGFVRNGIAREVIGPQEGLKFAPYLACLFVFIFILNFYEILPFAQTPVTGRIAYPGFLAAISLIMFNYVGVRRHGFRRYFKDMLFPPGVPKWLYVILTPIEFFSTIIARPFTLAVRLLMNMFAGHLLLLVFTAGTLYLASRDNISVVFTPVSFVMAVLLTFFELIIIAIQAYVFTVLTAVYVSGALAEEH